MFQNRCNEMLRFTDLCVFGFLVLEIPRVFVVVGRMVINTYILILRIPDVRCLLAYNIIYTYIGGQVLSFLICRVVVLFVFVCLLFLKSSHCFSMVDSSNIYYIST